MPRKRETYRWEEAPEIEDWEYAEFDDLTPDARSEADRQLFLGIGPGIGLGLGFGFGFGCYPRRVCSPRRICSPRRFCFPRQSYDCFPRRTCYPRPCFPV